MVLARRLEVVVARAVKLNKHIFLKAGLVLITWFQHGRPLIGLKKQGRWCHCWRQILVRHMKYWDGSYFGHTCIDMFRIEISLNNQYFDLQGFSKGTCEWLVGFNDSTLAAPWTRLPLPPCFFMWFHDASTRATNIKVYNNKHRSSLNPERKHTTIYDLEQHGLYYSTGMKPNTLHLHHTRW